MWHSPFPAEGAPAFAAPEVERAGKRREASSDEATGLRDDPAAGRPERPGDEWLRRPVPEAMPARPDWPSLPVDGGRLTPPAPVPGAAGPGGEAQRAAPSAGANAGTVIGHNLLMMAGLLGELPPALVTALQARPGPPPALARHAQRDAAPFPAGSVPDRPRPAGSRWSADAWVLLRDDGDGPLLPERAAYGRSQAGAVLRYRLARATGHAPQAYLRGSGALRGSGTGTQEGEVAAGVSARPIPALPVRVAVEARVSDTSDGASVRPAAYAVSEINPVALPFGTQGDLYLQAGYVGGDFETAFVDGQARVEKPLGGTGPAEFFAGAAAWGGAQRGASRLDAGPSLGASLSLAGVRGRLTADYRFRIVGESRPASGPALTLYAGF